MSRFCKPASPFCYFNSSPEIIRLVVYVRYPLWLRNVEDLLFDRGIDICHETVRFWWNRFGLMFANQIRKRRVIEFSGYRHWRWHVAEVFVKIRRIIFGALLITRVKFWKAMLPGNGIKQRQCAS